LCQIRYFAKDLFDFLKIEQVLSESKMVNKQLGCETRRRLGSFLFHQDSRL